MKSPIRTMLGMLLMVSFIVMAIGCSNSNDKEGNQNAESGTAEPAASPTASGQAAPEAVTLKIYGPDHVFGGDYPSGVQNDEVAMEIARQTGVTLDFETHPDDQKFNLMLASGDLPDIIVTDKQYVKQLIEGNNVIPLDELMQTYGKDILSESAGKLEFSRQYLSNDTGKLYFIQGYDGPPAKPANYTSVAPLVRWDLYKQLGYPEVRNTDELLDVLKRMQDLNPENEEGKKTYALSPWFGDQAWGLWNVVTYFGYNIKGTNDSPANHLFDVDAAFNAKSMITEDDSSLWTGLRFYYKANQMGILDPDSFTQKFDNVGEKGKSNRILSSWVIWALGGANENYVATGQPEKGFEPLPPLPGTSQYLGHYNGFGVESRLYAISKNSKHPERAMAVINYLHSAAGSELLFNGIKDVHWKIENDKPVVLDSVLQAATGEADFQARTGIGKYANFAGHGDGYVDPAWNVPVKFPSWNEYARQSMTELDKDYSAHYGVSYPGEVVENRVESGEAKLSSFNTIIDSLLPTPPDDIKRIDDKMMDYLLNNYPKAILAKNDEEFARIKSKMTDDLMKMDFQRSYDFWIKAFADAKAEAAKY